jgi:RNA polymerase sigma-70 factor (ECF subfamily)
MVDQAQLEAWLERFRAGDERAFACLYQEYSGTVYRIALRVTQSFAEAADVTQDVFLGLPRAIRNYRECSHFEGWLRTVAVRTAYMRVRATGRRREVHDPGQAGPRGDPDVSSALDRLDLERALALLPAHLRVVFVLKEVEGFSHREIGEALGISEGASSVRLSRARERLRKMLSEDA